MKVFAGTVDVYNEKIDVDTSTGKGLDRVLKKIEPLLFKMSKSSFMRGYAQEDIRQELAILAIEGVRSYDPSKNVKLSTFLHIHLKNKMISKIKSDNKIGNNANINLDTKLPDVCKCGSTTFLSVVKSFSEKRTCTSCGKIYTKKAFTAKQEIPFCLMDEKIDSEEDGAMFFSDLVSSEDNVIRASRPDIKNIELLKSIETADPSLDEKMIKLLYLISFDDCSIGEAASQVGMSGWEANSKLKKLSKNKNIKSFLKS